MRSLAIYCRPLRWISIGVTDKRCSSIAEIWWSWQLNFRFPTDSSTVYKLLSVASHSSLRTYTTAPLIRDGILKTCTRIISSNLSDESHWVWWYVENWGSLYNNPSTSSLNMSSLSVIRIRAPTLYCCPFQRLWCSWKISDRTFGTRRGVRSVVAEKNTVRLGMTVTSALRPDWWVSFVQNTPKSIVK